MLFAIGIIIVVRVESSRSLVFIAHGLRKCRESSVRKVRYIGDKSANVWLKFVSFAIAKRVFST